MRDIDHVLRVAGTFVLVIVAFLVARSFLIPKSFGKLGYYRADAVEEIESSPLRHAGQAECANCHGDKMKEKRKGKHSLMSCESCHGAGQVHAEDPAGRKPMKVSLGEMRSFCGRCHEKSVSRPRRFPQVNLHAHNPDTACSQCHNPHQPGL